MIPPASDAGRGPGEFLAVLFTDIVGFTDFGTRFGDRAAGDLLEAHDKLIRQELVTHRGTEIKHTGDGFLVTFGRVEDAVACAAAIQRTLAERNRSEAGSPIMVRIGINAGDVAEHGSDVRGSAVNAAARITAKAGPGEILVDAGVKRLAGTCADVGFRDRGTFRLKGFDDRRRLFQVNWDGDTRVDLPPRSQRTLFLGRESERSQIESLCEAAVRGSGTVVLIAGEPGVGKTRLTSEVGADAARLGMRVLTGRCYDTEGAPPYVPFLEILEQALAQSSAPQAFRDALGPEAADIARVMPQLRRIFDDIPAALELPPEQERRHLLTSLRDVISRAARATPLLLVLDDLHWADGPTLMLLEHLAERLADLPVLVVGTYRDLEAEMTPNLRRTLENLRRRHVVHRFALKPFDHLGAEAMLHALAGHAPPAELVDAVHAETEGNPFFIEEVFRYLADAGRLFDGSGHFRADLRIDEFDVPESVRLVIDRRLTRVSATCREMLTIAAVSGRGFSFNLLQGLSDAEPDALLDAIDEAEGSKLVLAQSDGKRTVFSFAHELIRQTLVSGTTVSRRQRLHLRVADALERVYAHSLEDHVPDISHHLLEAGDLADTDKIVRYLTIAGERAMTAADFDAGLRSFAKALELPAPDDGRRADLLRNLGLAQRCLGRWDEALASWDQALDAYERRGDVEAMVSLCYMAAKHLAWRTRFVASMQLANRGLTALGSEVTADGSKLLAMSGANLSVAGFPGQGEPLVKQAVAAAESLDNPGALAYVTYANTAFLFGSASYSEMLELGAVAERRLRDLGNLWDLASLHSYLVQANFFVGNLPAAERMAEELIPLVEKLGHMTVLPNARRVLAWISLARDADLTAWRRFANDDIGFGEANNLPLKSDGHSFAGLGRYWVGDTSGALEELRLGAANPSPGAYGGNVAVATFYEALINPEIAPAVTHPAPPADSRQMSRGQIISALFDVERHAVEGNLGAAAAHLPFLEDLCTRGHCMRPYDFRLIPALAGVAALARGDAARGRQHFDRALQLAETLPVRMQQAETRRLHAMALGWGGLTGEYRASADPGRRPRR